VHHRWRNRAEHLDVVALVLGERAPRGDRAALGWRELGGRRRRRLRDLRRGRWSIQGHVDLHGMNRHEAHEQVTEFVAESLAAGKRCLRIVHGRGHGSPGREAILRQLVKVWLGRCKEVLAFCHAPPSDGGDGALWVLLKAGGKALYRS